MLKGFRTYLLAVAIAAETLLTQALAQQWSWEATARGLVIASAIATLRTVTNTAPGRKE